jgi:CheY-like chemotaxis protein
MKKILLVNNQEAFLDRNKGLLNRAGFLILTATSANEALQICRKEAVDLIIAQLDMPGTRGDLLCSLIRQDNSLRSVSIILVCYESESDLADNCGANAVVTKPVRPESLLNLVGKFLGIHARREYRAVFNAKLAGSRERLEFSGMTRNISATGMLCETATVLNQNDLLSNLLFPLGSDQIVANGKVIWCGSLPDGKYSYGVQFIDLDPELRDKIVNFVSAAEVRQPAEV